MPCDDEKPLNFSDADLKRSPEELLVGGVQLAIRQLSGGRLE